MLSVNIYIFYYSNTCAMYSIKHYFFNNLLFLWMIQPIKA